MAKIRSTWQILKFWTHPIVGTMLAEFGAIKLARRVMQRTLAIALEQRNPRRIATVYSAQAYIENRRGDKTLAITLLKKAIEVTPDDDMYYCELGLLYKGQENYADAAVYLIKALQLLEPDVDLKFKLRLEGELQECLEKLKHLGNSGDTLLNAEK